MGKKKADTCHTANVSTQEGTRRALMEEMQSECWGMLQACWAETRPPLRVSADAPDQCLLQQRLGEGGYVLALDIDGTMLTTEYDEADDVVCINTRAGLREMLVRVSGVQPLLTIGILTAASERYAAGARRLISDLTCGFMKDIFDFCVSEQLLKDLSVLHPRSDRILLVDNDPEAIKPVARKSTVLVPDFDYNPKGRDPVLLDVAALVDDLTQSKLPVATFLAQCAKKKKHIYAHEGFYYVKRYCAECQEPETPTVRLSPDAEYGTWDFFCPPCLHALDADVLDDSLSEAASEPEAEVEEEEEVVAAKVQATGSNATAKAAQAAAAIGKKVAEATGAAAGGKPQQAKQAAPPPSAEKAAPQPPAAAAAAAPKKQAQPAKAAPPPSTAPAAAAAAPKKQAVPLPNGTTAAPSAQGKGSKKVAPAPAAQPSKAKMAVSRDSAASGSAQPASGKGGRGGGAGKGGKKGAQSTPRAAQPNGNGAAKAADAEEEWPSLGGKKAK